MQRSRPIRRVGMALGISVPLGTLLSCSLPSETGLKLLNATEGVALATDVRVNGKSVSSKAISLPPRTAQQSSPEGHVAGVAIRGGESLAVTFTQDGRSVQSACVLAPRPQGVCLVQASYSGIAALTCWFDCEALPSK